VAGAQGAPEVGTYLIGFSNQRSRNDLAEGGNQIQITAHLEDDAEGLA
jgi:hypothetical protein